ncbi:MAG: hypothetical protein F9K32_17565 [Desulfobulbaceae bacterium]|nr:MAG: hypothetical protein F9K32_17565 [Desulfobulbaceae bacterium]
MTVFKNNGNDFSSYWWLALIAAVIFIGSAASPFVFSNNPQATAVFSVLLTFITTTASILATKYYAKMDYQNTLTRYGLQAWRNLDSLAIKVEKAINRDTIESFQLEEWLLDIDRAKLGWRDLLQELFALQERLEKESSEIAVRYQEQLKSASTPEEVNKIQKEREDALAEKSAKAPLPLRLPVSVPCPECGTEQTGLLGTNSADTGWILCVKCNVKFAVHRAIDGSVRVGGTLKGPKKDTPLTCPDCNYENSIDAKKTAGIILCDTCNTHILYSGSKGKFKVESLGVTNSEISCPYCNEKQQIWINPTREVAFLTSCKKCNLPVQISGSKDNIHTSKFEKVTSD